MSRSGDMQDSGTSASRGASGSADRSVSSGGGGGGKYVPPSRRSNNSTVSETEDEKKRQRAARFSKKPDTSGHYGFVSRGEDNRLQKSRDERERFFKRIINEFVLYCDHTSKASLSKELQLFVEEELAGTRECEKSKYAIESILSSLRKLREALLNSSPDKFSVKVFLFSVRISASIGHYQTYIPSINYLIGGGAKELLTCKEVDELATLLILHLSHFNNQHTRAIETYNKYFGETKNEPLLHIITSWYLKDFNTWIKFYNSETDNLRSRIMRFGINEVVKCIINTISLSYYNIDLPFLQRTLPNGIDMNTLITEYKVPWKLTDNKTIIIKERKFK